ncbi:hypothetical protein L207DRAFT_525839 [Hyaloscypha variabilis F]|uniref:Uncharacterized protein n=1 Tax=Hyaloscypha variabilis (strain UAMH 11265 / GT02V1 / F) TaxID=1149755 RepID=A0A2J6S189_HYAVF|nr:hypothetical protein L207DRAFT_525839 [Hyaloscypha variabilis F]
MAVKSKKLASDRDTDKIQKDKPEKPEKPRLSKEERERLKRTVTIGHEYGVGPSNRKMKKNEKKCLSKGKKKMEKLVKREEERKGEKGCGGGGRGGGGGMRFFSLVRLPYLNFSPDFFWLATDKDWPTSILFSFIQFFNPIVIRQ